MCGSISLPCDEIIFIFDCDFPLFDLCNLVRDVTPLQPETIPQPAHYPSEGIGVFYFTEVANFLESIPASS